MEMRSLLTDIYLLVIFNLTLTTALHPNMTSLLLDPSVDTVRVILKRNVANSMMSEIYRHSGSRRKPLPSSLKINMDVLCSTETDTYIVSAYLGQLLALPCTPCKSPPRKKKSWYRQSKTQAREMPLTMENSEGISISGKGQLTIGSILHDDAGKYYCKAGGKYLSSYDITVVKGPHFHQGDTASTSTTMYTLWSPWSECNECDQKGERFRIGQCYAITPEFAQYKKGVPCTIQSPDVTSHRPDEQLIEECNAVCPDITPRQTTQQGMGGKKPTLPPMADRKTIYQETDGKATMLCPGGGVGVAIRWQRNKQILLMKALKNDIIEDESGTQQRIVIQGANTVHVHKLKKSDSAIYSCWLEGQLLATVRIVVTDPIVVDDGIKGYLMYSGIPLVGVVVFLMFVSVIKNRKNEALT
ncbi:Ig-like V-type domain-containing protein FAM187A [Saccoglossus kowalevskii]